MTAISVNELSRNTVYAAIELSKKNWVLGIATPERDRPSIHRMAGGNLQALAARLRTAARTGLRILVCYEAGYDGFWANRSGVRPGSTLRRCGRRKVILCPSGCVAISTSRRMTSQ
jgi:hypothetical protein